MENYTMTQVVHKTGLPASTIRYYDQQLGEYLNIGRSKGRQRAFGPNSVELLLQVHQWLKEEGLSLRQVRKRLAGEDESGEGSKLAALAARQQRNERQLEEMRKEINELKDIQQRALTILMNLSKNA
jgi:DNA-binding transcriptional MerR regulator